MSSSSPPPPLQDNIAASESDQRVVIDRQGQQDSPNAVRPPDNWQSSVWRSINLLTDKHLPLMVIFIFLMNNFGSFIYTAVMLFLVFLSLTFFNYLRIFQRAGFDEGVQKYSETFYHLFIFTLFFAYFINNQSQDTFI